MFRHKELLGRFEQVSAGSDVLLNVSLVFLLASWLTLPVWTFCILSQGRSSQGSDFLLWGAVENRRTGIWRECEIAQCPFLSLLAESASRLRLELLFWGKLNER